MEDWSLVYKLSLLLTAIFHPNMNVRKFSLLYVAIWFVLGNVRDSLNLTSTWFLYQSCYEVLFMVIVFRLLGNNIATRVIVLQGFLLVGLNLHQYLGWYKGDIFYDSFLSTSDYIYWNKWGFEVILLMLWMKEEVFSAVRARWTVNNVIMVYVIGWIVYLVGNY